MRDVEKKEFHFSKQFLLLYLREIYLKRYTLCFLWDFMLFHFGNEIKSMRRKKRKPNQTGKEDFSWG